MVLKFDSKNVEAKNLKIKIIYIATANLSASHKYKEAAEAYASCSKYDISIIKNTDYINALGKYADSELVPALQEDIHSLYPSKIKDVDRDNPVISKYFPWVT